MKNKKSILLWIFSFLFTVGIAYYQRVTGPTYPISSKVTINGETVKNKLLRTTDADGDEEIKINAPTGVSGILKYKRYKSNDNWTEVPLIKGSENLIAKIPHQAPAGKVMYSVRLISKSDTIALHNEPVIIRYKGKVPWFVLFPHILFMFIAMFLSTRTGLEDLTNGLSRYKMTLYTMFFLGIGGIILGPIMQKYAFGIYWSGWPLGHDLTDNKTAVAFIGWVVAFIRLWKKPNARGWALVASIILFVIYMIPHSMFGSEIDYTATP